jgi:hypothetical protein
MMKVGDIDVWDYVRVVSDKKLKGSGLTRGMTLMVVGTQLVPASKKDPYIKRTIFNTIKVVDGEHQIPSEKNGYMAYLIDPKSVDKVGSEEAKELNILLNKQYSQ